MHPSNGHKKGVRLTMKDKTNKVETVIKPGRFDYPRILRWVFVVIIYLIIFSGLDQLAHTLQLFPGVVAWYPPDGLSLAFLLTFGVGFTPVFSLASLFSSLLINHFSTPLGPILVWAVILSAIYGIEAVILRGRVRIDPELKALRDTLWLILTSAVAATILAVISVSVLIHYGEIPAAQYFNAVADWWIGEMTGVVVFTPFLLIHVMPSVKRFIDGEWGNFKKHWVFRRPSLQSIGQIISIPVILYIAFGIPALGSFEPYYLIAGPLIWIALKNGFSRASLAIVGMNFGTMLAIWLFKFDTSHLGELQFLTLGIYASTLLTGAIVTRQKRIEEVLRQSEVRNRALIENAPDGITLLGADGRVKYSSPSTQRILGYDPAEWIGSHLAEFTHPDDLPALQKLMDDLVQHPGKVVTTQYRFHHKDESWRWLESTLTNLLTEPSVQAIVSNFRDITERKQTEETVQNSEKRFRALVENSQEEVSLVDADGTLIYESPTARRPLGYPANSFVGHNLFDLLHPDERAVATQLLEQVIKHPGSSKEALFRLRHRDGSWRWMEGFLTNLMDDPAVQSVVINYRDITERKRTEQEIVNLAKFPSENPNPVLRVTQNGIVMYANNASEALLRMWACAVGSSAPQFWRDLAAQALATKENKIVDIECDGKVYSMFVTPVAEPGYVNIYGRDITERKQAEDAMRMSEEKYRTLVDEVNDGFYVTDKAGVFTFANSALARMYGVEDPQMLVGRKYSDFIAPDMPMDHGEAYDSAIQTGQTPEVINGQVVRPDGTRTFIEIKPTMIVKGGQIAGTRGVVRDITARKQAEEEIKISNDELSMLFELSHALAEADGLEEILDLVNRHAVESIHTTFARIALLEDENYIMRAVYPIRVLDHSLGIGERIPVAGLPSTHRVLEQKEPMILRASDTGISDEEKKALLLDFAQSVCLIPLRISDSSRISENLMGVLMLGEARKESREPFTPEKIRLAQTIGDSAAIAIRRMLLREQTERRLQQLTALSYIDQAISSTFDLHFSLGVLLQQVSAQLGADATDVLLYSPHSHTLEFSAGRGFRSKPFEHTQLRLGEGYAGQAALRREIIHISNLTELHDNPRLEKHLADEQFVSYYGVPLIAKGEIKGVLEIFQRALLEPDKEWLEFLGTLAGQAAIAIDSVMQFDNVQRSNRELSLAYDETIQGWSHALDLRDNETEGHTQRVTELTVKLGRNFGLSDEELVQVRRGALLHDIGKMGVPDGILLKPGPLTDEEWVIMRKHTTFAYEMLSPIHYLHAALDIPYCHHEKWDGKGYPRGLRGEQIPFAARIFAVVDVWDALTSDRVYRAAWPKEKVLDYIRSLSGSHFDPQVVKTCLESGLLNK